MSRPTRRNVILAGAAVTLPALDLRTDYRGQIAASQAAELMKKESLSRDALMLKLLSVAQSHAYAPISNYFVGAVASGVSGNLYLGQNIEIPGNPLGLAVHAEQSATANAYMCGESGIDAIAVRGSPCGHCRQFLSEINLEMRVLTPDRPPAKLADLLPNAFGPHNLGFSKGAFPIIRTNLSLTTDSQDALVLAALKAASQAYAPYSHSLSGAAILTSNSRIFSGSYIENAAFNPSLPPLQCALAGYFAAAPQSGEIRRAILIEGVKSTISQRVTSQATLSAFAPSIQLECLTFKN